MKSHQNKSILQVTCELLRVVDLEGGRQLEDKFICSNMCLCHLVLYSNN